MVQTDVRSALQASTTIIWANQVSMPVLAVHSESTLRGKAQASVWIARLDLTVEVYNLYAVLSVLLVVTLHRRGKPSAHRAQLILIPRF